MSGNVQEDKIHIGGAGADINMFDLTASHGIVDINGVGNVRISAHDNLEVTISGVGHVIYRGNPTIQKHISGIGTVSPEK
jgi:hypothetical protein